MTVIWSVWNSRQMKKTFKAKIYSYFWPGSLHPIGYLPLNCYILNGRLYIYLSFLCYQKHYLLYLRVVCMTEAFQKLLGCLTCIVYSIAMYVNELK